MKNILKPILLPHWAQDFILAIPRIICGYLLAFDFGASKFGMPWTDAEKNLSFFQVVDWFPEDVANYGGVFAVAPTFFAWMGAFSEAVGGLFLMFGLFTRPFALLITLTMLVAIFFQQWDEGLWNMLAAMGFLWVSMYALVTGSGRFGIDYLLTKKAAEKNKEAYDSNPTE